MQPAIGRIVHYVSHGTPPREDGTQAYQSRCRAAIITEVSGRAVQLPDLAESDMRVASLCVLNPEGQFFARSVVQMEDGRNGGTWHWPERTPETSDVEDHCDGGDAALEVARVTGSEQLARMALGVQQIRGMERKALEVVAFETFMEHWRTACIEAWDKDEACAEPRAVLPEWLWPKVAGLINPVTQTRVTIERVASFPVGLATDLPMPARPEINSKAAAFAKDHGAFSLIFDAGQNSASPGYCPWTLTLDGDPERSWGGFTAEEVVDFVPAVEGGRGQVADGRLQLRPVRVPGGLKEGRRHRAGALPLKAALPSSAATICCGFDVSCGW